MPLRAKISDTIRATATVLLPADTRQWIRKIQRRLGIHFVPLGSVNYGDLRRLSPISPIFGIDRDLISIERHYIESFLREYASDIKGRVLEMGDPNYTVKFGADRVTKSDVLHYVEGNPKATIVADLTTAKNIDDNTFDCIIITQTLQMIYEIQATITNLHRILKPGGVVLATSHGITKVARREGVDDWGEYWHFTSQSSKRLFQETFPAEGVTVSTYGNVLSTIGSLHGLAASELEPNELDYCDPNFELLVMVRAQKAAV